MYDRSNSTRGPHMLVRSGIAYGKDDLAADTRGIHVSTQRLCCPDRMAANTIAL